MLCRPAKAMRAGAAPLRVMIVDDHELFAETLWLALEREQFIVHRLVPRDIAELMSATPAAVRRTGSSYDLVLLDLDLDGLGDGSRIIQPLVEADTVVVVVTGSTDRVRWGESLHLGASKVISKSRPFDEILSTVRRVHQGAPIASPAERAGLLRVWHERKLRADQVDARLRRLSPRERDVLHQLTLGRTVSDIAAAEHVSPATVRTHVKSILAKLEVSSQIAAVGMVNAARQDRV